MPILVRRFLVASALAGVLSLVGAARLSAEDGYWSAQVLRVSGSLDGTLYHSLDAVIPDAVLDSRERARLAWELADVFRWQADFVHGLKPGDNFRLVFERLTSQVGEVRYGRLIAAELVLGGKPLNAYEFDDPDGRSTYYDGEGLSLRRNFLIVPVEFRRISSGFASRRYHPILKLWRAHQGIDYAAEAGTPVMAAGDGVVSVAGWAGGYGLLVEIRHDNGVVTRYGHLKRFAPGIRPGARVVQGQYLGNVGATGLATGPHLHFEFLLHGVATDPRELDSDSGPPVTEAARLAFRNAVLRLRSVLERAPLPVAVRGTI